MAYLQVYCSIKKKILQGEVLNYREVTSFVKTSKMNLESLLIFADLSSKDERMLAKKFYPLALKLAKSYAIRYDMKHEFDDLLGVAQLAMAQSLKKYNPDKSDIVRKTGDPLSGFGPLAKMNMNYALRNYLSKKSEINPRSLTKSLDLPLSSSMMNKTLMDVVEDKTSGEDIDKVTINKAVKEILRNLTDVSKYIIIKKFGLDRRGEQNLDSIAKELGYGRSTVNKWLNAALKQLKSILLKRDLTPQKILSSKIKIDQ